MFAVYKSMPRSYSFKVRTVAIVCLPLMSRSGVRCMVNKVKDKAGVIVRPLSHTRVYSPGPTPPTPT